MLTTYTQLPGLSGHIVRRLFADGLNIVVLLKCLSFSRPGLGILNFTKFAILVFE
jgi:hypothetical protein